MECIIEGCDKKRAAKQMCGMHYQRVKRYGDPSFVSPPHGKGGNRAKGPEHPNWQGRDITYITAHCRIRSHRGLAKSYKCSCGEQAQEWAYDYSDPNPLTGVSRGYQVIFSPDVERYNPMCGPCHRDFDRNASRVLA